LWNTTNTRQQYRIDGVTRGSFRSVAPQSKDSVYDTVAFKEVPSRLARARGAVHQLDVHLQDGVQQGVATESDRLADLCLRAANQLSKFVSAESAADHILPGELSKDVVWPVLVSRKVRGKIVGHGREALRLTIKSVWDYPEMRRRGILPTAAERRKVNQECERIIASAESVRVAVLGQRT
jgi:predicted P-loop ATPase/GTPase